jgi:hypothetical protein
MASPDLKDAIQLPPGVIGFGLGEVAYLLSRHTGKSAARSRALILTDTLVGDTNFLRAGASSLVARGLLGEGDGGAPEARGWAALLEYALVVGTSWVELGIARKDRSLDDLAIIATAPAVSAVMQPRAVGSWFVGFHEDAEQLAVVKQVLDAVTDESPSATFSVSRMGPEGPPTDVPLVQDPQSGRWRVASSHQALLAADES